MNKEEIKVRTGEQLERENYLLCFKSKAQITNILIDTEQELDKYKHIVEEIKEEYKRFKEADFIDINLITFIEKVGEIIGD